MKKDYKPLVRDFIKEIEYGGRNLDKYVDPKHYRQHSLMSPDGFEGLTKFVASVPKGYKIDIVRIFQDDDLVIIHQTSQLPDHKVVFDIVRIKDDKIVEHWDNHQAMAGPNPSGHTMIDGPTAVRDHDKTESNKKLVKNFFDEVFINHQMDRMPHYFDGDNYIQHNPMVADGLSGLGQAMKEWAEKGMMLKVDKLHGIFGEGNFVLVVSQMHQGPIEISSYDLFRVEHNKIAEHWDVIERMPPKEQWKNHNGKFGF